MRRGSREDKASFILFSCLFVVDWLATGGDLVKHWFVVDGHLRQQTAVFLLSFLALWISALFQRVHGVVIALIAVSFASAGAIILRGL